MTVSTARSSSVQWPPVCSFEIPRIARWLSRASNSGQGTLTTFKSWFTVLLSRQLRVLLKSTSAISRPTIQEWKSTSQQPNWTCGTIPGVSYSISILPNQTLLQVTNTLASLTSSPPLLRSKSATFTTSRTRGTPSSLTSTKSWDYPLPTKSS